MLALTLALPAAPASAHAELVSTTPAEGEVLVKAPSSVEFTFDEPVFLVPDGFQLYDGSGGHHTVSTKMVDATVRATLPANLADGSYLLGWRVVSDDSHPESGVLSFAVGQASASAPIVVETDTGPVDILYGIVTALGYIGLFCLVGLTVFDLFIARAPVAGRRLPRLAALVAVSAYIVLVPLTVVRERGSALSALVDSAVTLAGLSAGAVMTLVFAAAGSALMLLRARLLRRQAVWVGTAGAALALASVLPVGHTRTFGPTWLVMGADLVHAASAAMWLGGLIGLLLYLSRARRRQGNPAEAAVVLGRFSVAAGGLAVMLGVTGTILAVVIVGSVPALVGSAYGQLLLVKVGMVVMIGGLAGWNRFGLVPRVSRQELTGRAWRLLTLVLRLEAVGVVLVLGLTSALTLQNPRATDTSLGAAPAAAHVLSAGGTPVLAELGTGHLNGRFRPGESGASVITFDLSDAGGSPIVPLGLPQVSAAEPNLSLGPVLAEVEPGQTPGSYRAVMVLPEPGQWKITVAVRVNELERPAAVIDVAVSG
ncbi:copper resistance CopC/CopD family protein [Cryobacterium lactosi]|uniref:copper resistance CopC/CopD family protein n=1 Tax=Cryobacterium lactosi TaxID=1259202 RepID=UPI00141A9228|nr:copper resistance protein CopC [Cryobacterium lactosi]